MHIILIFSFYQMVEIPSMQITRKVKSMQMFRQPVESAIMGDRVGICVTQFDPKLLERGLVCTPGSLPTIEGKFMWPLAHLSREIRRNHQANWINSLKSASSEVHYSSIGSFQIFHDILKHVVNCLTLSRISILMLILVIRIFMTAIDQGKMIHEYSWVQILFLVCM